MAMPDPTLGRVQDTGHAGMRQGFQSIMDSLNQNSQMAMSAIENWKQRDYAAQEAEKERLFKAKEALEARTQETKLQDTKLAHEASEGQKNRANQQTIANIHESGANYRQQTALDNSQSMSDRSLMYALGYGDKNPYAVDPKTGKVIRDSSGRLMLKSPVQQALTNSGIPQAQAKNTQDQITPQNNQPPQ